jgi:hypothetical protein
MATPTLTSLMTDLLLNPGSPTNLGTGNAQASETVINLVGTSCAATGHSGSVGPTSNPSISQLRGMYNTVTSTARAFNKHIHAWVRDLYPIRDVNVGGVGLYLFDGSEADFFVTGLDKGYKGGWQHVVISIDTADRPSPSIGSQGTGNITRVGYLGNISASKGEDFLQNCYLDAIRVSTNACIRLSGGTSGDPFGWSDIPVADTAEYGIVRDIGGTIFVEGGFEIGNTGLTTYFHESLKTITFSALTVNNGTGGNTVVPAVHDNYYRIQARAGTHTEIVWTDVTLVGDPLVPFQFFLNLFTTPADANNFASFTRCTFINFAWFLLNDNITFDRCTFVDGVKNSGIICENQSTGVFQDCNFINCEFIQLFGAVDMNWTIDGGSTTGHSTATGVHYITNDFPDRISNHAFDNTGGTGHAIYVATAGTYDFVGNTFTGYGGTPGSNLTPNSGSQDAAIYNNSGGLVTLNITGGGNLPSIRNGAGATTVCNLTVPITITVQDTAGNPIQGAKVFLETTPGGTDIIAYDITDASGQVTTTYGGATPQAVVGYVAKGTASPVYKRATINDTISTTGLAATITMVLDE